MRGVHPICKAAALSPYRRLRSVVGAAGVLAGSTRSALITSEIKHFRSVIVRLINCTWLIFSCIRLSHKISWGFIGDFCKFPQSAIFYY